MNRRGEYRIRNAAENPAVTEILLYDEIGEDPWFGTGVSAKAFAEDLSAVDTAEVHVRLNSPGGNVFEGIAMMNALRRHNAKVTVFVDGLAASAASIVAMGADEVVMSRQAELMIHDAWGVAIGNAKEMQTMADDLNRASDNLAAAYKDKAGGTVSDWREAMQAETWYSDKEAVAAGLADRVEPSKTASDKAKARFNLSVFAYAGRADAPAPYLPAKPPDSVTDKEGPAMPDTLAKVRQRLGISADADEAAIMAALDTVAADNDTDPNTETDPDEATETEDTEDDADEVDGSLPGTVTIDEGVLNQLRTDAQAGRDARAQQLTEHRENLVSAAIRDGRISLARKADWLNKLEKDSGSETELAALATGLVPVDGPHGYTGSLSDVAEDDALYNKLFAEKAV
jgi:ATP-dependent protease ClpP protease subunit